MEYLRKAAHVEAFRLNGDSEVTAPAWFAKEIEKGNVFFNRVLDDGISKVYGCTITTSTERIRARNGDYIVRDEFGNIGKCTSSQFRKQYEKVKR